MQHTPEEIARAIAQGHAYDTHVVKQREFDGTGDRRCGDDTGVRTRDDFEAHILKTITDPNIHAFVGEDGASHFYDQETNTHVVYDPGHEDLGTCMRPTSRERLAIREWREDCEKRGWQLSRFDNETAQEKDNQAIASNGIENTTAAIRERPHTTPELSSERSGALGTQELHERSDQVPKEAERARVQEQTRIVQEVQTREIEQVRVKQEQDETQRQQDGHQRQQEQASRGGPEPEKRPDTQQQSEAEARAAAKQEKFAQQRAQREAEAREVVQREAERRKAEGRGR